MDKSLIQKRFGKASKSYGQEAVAQKIIVSKLMDMLPSDSEFDKQVQSLLEIGCGNGLLTQQLTQRFQPQLAVINDLSPEWEEQLQTILSDKAWQFIAGDAEHLHFEEKFDLIASSSTIQWFDNPAIFLANMYQQLNAGGIILLSTFGHENLKEIKQITGEGLSYYCLSELSKYLPSEAKIESKEESIILSFKTPLDILKHLKKTGVNGTQQKLWTKGMMNEFCESYCQQYASEEGFTLSYQPLYLKITKPYE
jgi:malonyl-CoA O-methyltransferase/biotin synthesis protein BioG